MEITFANDSLSHEPVTLIFWPQNSRGHPLIMNTHHVTFLWDLIQGKQMCYKHRDRQNQSFSQNFHWNWDKKFKKFQEQPTKHMPAYNTPSHHHLNGWCIYSIPGTHNFSLCYTAFSVTERKPQVPTVQLFVLITSG